MKRKIKWVVPAINAAVGGLRVILDYNQYLNEEGYDSSVFHYIPKGDPREKSHLDRSKGYPFQIDFFGHKYRSADKIGDDDIVIFSEPDFENMVYFNKGERVCFVQNWHGVEEHILSRVGNFADIGITKLLAISDFTKSYLYWKMPKEHQIEVTSYELDFNKFYPTKEKITKPKILIGHKHIVPEYLTSDYGRKVNVQHRNLAYDIPKLFEQKGIDAEFGVLLNVDYNKVGDYMRTFTHYLHLGIEEGQASPPVEALACGLAVFGFSGMSTHLKPVLKHLRFTDNGNIISALETLRNGLEIKINKVKQFEDVKSCYNKETARNSLFKALTNLKLI